MLRSSALRAVVHPRFASGTRTAMSPYAGGPIYRSIRSGILSFKRNYQRNAMRYIDRNYDLVRAASYGEPEVSLNYHANYWKVHVDQTYQDGVLTKAYQDFWSWIPYAFAGLMVGAIHIRWVHNDKYNVFKKWRTIED